MRFFSILFFSSLFHFRLKKKSVWFFVFKKKRGDFDCLVMVRWYLKLKSCYFFQQVVKCLMDYNAKQNKKDIYGNTPLIYACLNGQYETAALLLQVRLLNAQNSISYMISVLIQYSESVYLVRYFSVRTTWGKNKSICYLTAFNPFPSCFFYQINITLLLHSYMLLWNFFMEGFLACDSIAQCFLHFFLIFFP